MHSSASPLTRRCCCARYPCTSGSERCVGGNCRYETGLVRPAHRRAQRLHDPQGHRIHSPCRLPTRASWLVKSAWAKGLPAGRCGLSGGNCSWRPPKLSGPMLNFPAAEPVSGDFPRNRRQPVRRRRSVAAECRRQVLRVIYRIVPAGNSTVNLSVACSAARKLSANWILAFQKTSDVIFRQRGGTHAHHRAICSKIHIADSCTRNTRDVIAYRRAHSIGLGDANDGELRKRIRAHGNAIRILCRSV